MDLTEMIPAEQWSRHREFLELAEKSGRRFALGAGLAHSYYARRRRKSKDLDLYIQPFDGQVMIDLLTKAGFQDYYEQSQYDRTWIYRGVREGVVIDLIWAVGNYAAVVTEPWLTRGPEVNIHGFRLRLLTPEDLIRSKLYLLIFDRTDWPDLLNILYAMGPELDWTYLVEELGEDALLLGGLLSVFRWMCPARARELPEWVWERTGLLASVGETFPDLDCRTDHRRVARLDVRDWFGPTEVEGAR
jgi:hypothetical protein